MGTFDARDLNLNLAANQLKPLFQTKPHLHAQALILNWAIIFTTMWLCSRYMNPLTYVAAVTIIGARMHALAILMHDATHYRFLKNRRWNDVLTNVLTMYPLFSSIEQYRQNHLRHHRHLNTEEDPDWVAKLGKREFTFPKTRREFLLTVLAYFTLYRGISDALWFLRRFGGTDAVVKAQNGGNKGAKLAFYLLLVLVLSVFGWWKYFLIFWIVPYLSTFFMFQYIRSVAEHFGDLAYDHLLTSTRSVKPAWWEKFLLAPHHVGYHIEHHLYPAVPFYHLPQLHRLLMSVEEYHGKAHITQGYLRGLLNELG